MNQIESKNEDVKKIYILLNIQQSLKLINQNINELKLENSSIEENLEATKKEVQNNKYQKIKSIQ